MTSTTPITASTAPGALAAPETERLVELESIVERGLQTFFEVGQALAEICGPAMQARENLRDKAWVQKARSDRNYGAEHAAMRAAKRVPAPVQDAVAALLAAAAAAGASR